MCALCTCSQLLDWLAMTSVLPAPAHPHSRCQVIKAELEGSTILEVAHRQSTLACCGRLVVMEAGRVAGQG